MKKLFYGIALLMLCFCLSTCSNDTTPSATLTVINTNFAPLENLQWGRDGEYFYNKKKYHVYHKKTYHILGEQKSCTRKVKPGSYYLYFTLYFTTAGSHEKIGTMRTREKITVKENEEIVFVFKEKPRDFLDQIIPDI